MQLRQSPAQRYKSLDFCCDSQLAPARETIQTHSKTTYLPSSVHLVILPAQYRWSELAALQCFFYILCQVYRMVVIVLLIIFVLF